MVAKSYWVGNATWIPPPRRAATFGTWLARFSDMFTKRTPVAKILGFEIRLDPSWIFLAILITWSLAIGLFPQSFPQLNTTTWWLMGIVATLGLLASIVIHELSHSWVARHHGIEIGGITLFLFGGIAETTTEPKSPKAEFQMAIAGPLMSLLISGFFYGLSELSRRFSWHEAILGVFSYLATLNLVLAVFNLVPAFPLDGGRVLRAILWRWKRDFILATRWATLGGSTFGLLLLAFGILNALRGNFLGGMWLFLIGLFLRGAAKASYQNVLMQQSLQGETIERYMNRSPVTVKPSHTIQEFIDEYVFTYQHKMFPVVDDKTLLGCARMEDIRKVPRAQWSNVTLADVITTCPPASVLHPKTDAKEALDRMQRSNRACFVVAQGDRLLGVISLKDMMKRLSFKMEMEEATTLAA